MSTRERRTTPIILVAAIGALLAGGWGLQVLGGNQEGFGAAARFTARWSFLWFMTAWSASALATLWPGGWRSALLYNRRGLGLAFATAHLIHAAFFLVAILIMGRQTSPATVIGGGLGYVFVILMALTSTDEWVRKLTPKRWKLLHTVGASYIAFIFAFTYLGAVMRGAPIGTAALSLMGLVVALKLAAWAKKRGPQPA
jgi:sulfoxide reductase heme-binding subunit YedZ